MKRQQSTLKKSFFYVLVPLLCIFSLGMFLAKASTEPETPIPEPVAEPAKPPLPFPVNALDEKWKTKFEIEEGDTIYDTLRHNGLSIQDTRGVIAALESETNLRRIKALTKFTTTWQNRVENKPLSVELRLDKTTILDVERDQNDDTKWVVEEVVKEPKIVQRTFKGIVENSLWESAEANGLDHDLIMALTDVFAWQIDFNREVRFGDRWRLVVDELLVDGEPIGWGKVRVAEYKTKEQSFMGILYESADHTVSGYFDTEGESLRQMFLKSPLQFGKVTSGFSHRRFHPILKVNLPHNGVDYGAPRGTPVHSVGNGVVEFAGYNGTSGNMIKIQHNSVYTTSYLHLDHIQKGLRKGSRITQGMVIGYVGSTGRATGPHLHFAFYENGVFVNPQGRKFPSADPVPTTKMPEFNMLKGDQIVQLPSWDEKITWHPPKVLSVQ